MSATCPNCGKPVPPSALQGLCPECMLQLGAASQTEVPGEVGPHGTKVVPPPPPRPEEIARHFPQLEILECLGRGGMGVVYKARQPRLDRLVALKILAPEKEQEPKFAERFTREAKALARLNHPNIVTVHDFGEADGLYYLMMEYVDGMTLRQLLMGKKMAPEQALSIVPKICEALQFAHEQGVVHRDIKPENVLLDKQGRVKIADFGIAKILGGGAEPLTPSLCPMDGERVPGEGTALTQDQIVGTPQYMAPEQVEKPATVDHRADIYSLGVVFYEMLTGELPTGKFPPPSLKAPVDARLDEVVLHALEREPARRYQHASDVKAAVDTIAGSAGSRGQTAGLPVPVLRWRDLWIWDTSNVVGMALVSMVIAFVLTGVLLPLLGKRALFFLLVWAVGLGFAAVYAVVGVSVRRLKAALPRPTGEVAECLMFRRPLQSPGLAVLHEDRLELVPIVGSPITVRLEEIVAVTEVRWFNGKRLWTKRGFVMELDTGRRVGVAVAEPFARRWRSRLSRGSLPELAPDPGEVATQPAGQVPRFSRTAIWGAAWAAMFFLVVVPFLVVLKVEPVSHTSAVGPTLWQIALNVLLLPLGLTAPLGSTVLGWIAVSQIRRSDGRLYGLGLAVFDGLLYPLLALGAFIVWMGIGFRLGVAEAIIIAVPVVGVVAWRIWRKVARSVASAGGGVGQPGPRTSAWIGLTWGALALGIAAATLLLIRPFVLHPSQATTDLAEDPFKLKTLPTAQLIDIGLGKPNLPWAWQGLGRRAEDGRLSPAEATTLIHSMETWLRRDYPNGYRDPLHWLGSLLDELGKRKLVTEAQAVRFLDAFHGPPTLDPLPRLREGDHSLTLSSEALRNIWHDKLFGMVMLDEVRSVTMDGAPIPLPAGSRQYWRSCVFNRTLELPDLVPGKHTLKFEVESALVAEADMTGLPDNAPASDWPPAKRRWTRVAEAELQIFAKDAQIVSLTQDPALDPMAGGGLSARPIIIRHKGQRATAVISFDVSDKVTVPISFDVTLTVAGGTIPCRGFWHYKHSKGTTSGGGELAVDLDVPDPQIKEAALILTPNPRLIEAQAGVDRVWGKDIVFHHVPLTRQDLAKEKTATPLGFGPVLERQLRTALVAQEDRVLDLDYDRLLSVPTNINMASLNNPRPLLNWMAKQGADLIATDAGPDLHLHLDDGLLLRLAGEATFDSVAASQTRRRLAREGAAQNISIPKVEVGAQPAFIFQTGEGGAGVLQILGLGDAPPSLRIRYKLALQSVEKSAAAARGAGASQGP